MVRERMVLGPFSMGRVAVVAITVYKVLHAEVQLLVVGVPVRGVGVVGNMLAVHTSVAVAVVAERTVLN